MPQHAATEGPRYPKCRKEGLPTADVTNECFLRARNSNKDPIAATVVSSIAPTYPIGAEGGIRQVGADFR